MLNEETKKESNQLKENNMKKLKRIRICGSKEITEKRKKPSNKNRRTKWAGPSPHAL
jgi:hypothetical protein